MNTPVDINHITGNLTTARVDGETVWKWEGGDVIAITERLMLDNPHTSIDGQHMRLGQYTIRILAYDATKDLFICERINA